MTTTAMAIAMCRTIPVTSTVVSPVTAGRTGRNSTDVFIEAWSSVTDSRLPPVLLKTQVKMIDFATMSSRNSQNG
jgi:hypothetical protein